MSYSLTEYVPSETFSVSSVIIRLRQKHTTAERHEKDMTLTDGETSYRRLSRVVSGHRLYSPTLERWLNRDPIGEFGGVDLYGYVRNQCVNMVDGIGLMMSGGHHCETITKITGPDYVYGYQAGGEVAKGFTVCLLLSCKTTTKTTTCTGACKEKLSSRVSESMICQIIKQSDEQAGTPTKKSDLTGLCGKWFKDNPFPADPPPWDEGKKEIPYKPLPEG